jgi:hypothetical protein
MSLIPNIGLGYGYETEHSSHSEEHVAHETVMESIKGNSRYGSAVLYRHPHPFSSEVGSVTGIGNVVCSHNRRIAFCNKGIDRVERSVVNIDIFHCCQRKGKANSTLLLLADPVNAVADCVAHAEPSKEPVVRVPAIVVDGVVIAAAILALAGAVGA